MLNVCRDVKAFHVRGVFSETGRR